jgi:hypothetical protein
MLFLLAQSTAGASPPTCTDVFLPTSCAKIEAFREFHVSETPQKAADMLAADPEFLLNEKSVRMPKRNFIEWTQSCRVFSDEWIAIPANNPSVVAIAYTWLDCPLSDELDPKVLPPAGTFFNSKGRIKIRFWTASDGSKLVIAAHPNELAKGSKNG